MNTNFLQLCKIKVSYKINCIWPPIRRSKDLIEFHWMRTQTIYVIGKCTFRRKHCEYSRYLHLVTNFKSQLHELTIEKQMFLLGMTSDEISSQPSTSSVVAQAGWGSEPSYPKNPMFTPKLSTITLYSPWTWIRLSRFSAKATVAFYMWYLWRGSEGGGMENRRTISKLRCFLINLLSWKYVHAKPQNYENVFEDQTRFL